MNKLENCFGFGFAIQDYDHALRINPRYVRVRNNRRLVYARKGDYLLAMADRGRVLWTRYGTLGVSMPLCLLIISMGIIVKLSFERRFQKATRRPNS